MLNNVSLMGKFCEHPELRYTTNNTAVTSFTLAVDRDYVKSGDSRQADFIDVVAWRTTAEFICRNFSKGKLVAVQGTIQTRNYQDKHGSNRKATEILANHVYFAGPKQVRTEEHSPEDLEYSDDSFTDISDDDLPFN